MKRAIFLVAIIVIVGLVSTFGILLYDGSDSSSSSGGSQVAPSSNSGITSTNGKIYNVVVTSSELAPMTLTIKKGDTVIFTNTGTRDIWPATGAHPTHKIYPGSGIEKCGTAEESMIFDACRRVPVRDSYSFKFDEVGSWGYHDHLRSSTKGTIVVE